MKYDELNLEEVKVEEITPNTVEYKRRKKVAKAPKERKKIDFSSSKRDVWDFVIMQASIACGILAIILLVNLLGGASFESLRAVISRLNFNLFNAEVSANFLNFLI